MPWWQYQSSGAWWVVMPFLMVLFWVTLIAGAVLLVRHYGGWRAAAPTNAAIEALRLRLAKGEIDEEEFARLRRLLDESAPR